MRLQRISFIDLRETVQGAPAPVFPARADYPRMATPGERTVPAFGWYIEGRRLANDEMTTTGCAQPA